jgi:hypothetical protein
LRRREWPGNGRELAKLAYLLVYARYDELVIEAELSFAENRAPVNRIFDAAERGLLS